MCGIWAVIPRGKTGLYTADVAIARQMMLDTVQRGEHSTGIFATHYKEPRSMPTGVKVVGGPHNIYGNKPLWTELSEWMGLNAGCIIGHGRLATRGKVSAKNAHPFQHEHITMVHNGTLTSGFSLAKKGEVDLEVDSHALAVMMAEKGMLEALASIKGAYAIIAHDAKEGCLWIARNSERPLFVYTNNDRHLIMSEEEYLQALVDRNVGLSKHGADVLQFSSECLVKIDLFDPKEYQLAGDISELRKQKEKVQREIDRKSREEADKKYQQTLKKQNRFRHPANDYTAANPSGQVMMYPKVKKKSSDPEFVEFTVMNFRKWKSLYLYECQMTGGALVHFQTDSIKDGYIGRVGSAPVHTVHEKGMFTNYFVKHRSISWSDETVVEADAPDAGKEEAPPLVGGSFLTYNGKRIGTAAWRERIEGKEGCFMCDGDFTLLDYKTTVLTDDDKLLCQKCAKELHVYEKPWPHNHQPEILH